MCFVCVQYNVVYTSTARLRIPVLQWRREIKSPCDNLRARASEFERARSTTPSLPRQPRTKTDVRYYISLLTRARERVDIFN